MKFHFPASGKHGAVTINFYTGSDMPPQEAMAGVKETFNRTDRTGALLIGEKGTIMPGLWNNQCYLQMKEDKKKIKGAPEAESLINPKPRKGWA